MSRLYTITPMTTTATERADTMTTMTTIPRGIGP